MPFTKGNTLSTKRIKRKGGRPKSLSTQVEEAMAVIDRELPDIVKQLVERARDGDREALIYLIDRRMGKPRQATELDIKGGEELGVGTMVRLFKLIVEYRRRLEQRSLNEQAALTEGGVESQIDRG